ncbi:MAG: phosphate ABC transporter ATP-binding protein, partial [Methanomicrobiaceae archaeon]|nr:phosphate ABC transporter ATP-binding protein [Methanomicrobiaceae archaeon]
MLEIQNVTKQFGETPVLRGVSASIAKGEIFAVIGPSGVGKSTLLRLINLLDTPTGGRILLDGVDIHADRRRTLEFRRRMGMVFQKPAAFNATVYENIALGLRFRGESGRRVREKVAEGLDLVGLTGYEQRKARTLSGGEMQRVSLARVMVTDPEILLLDEPTANLDPVSAEVIEDLVLRINREYKTTVVMSTHDRFQGQRLARRIGVMMDGDFVQIGTPRE